MLLGTAQSVPEKLSKDKELATYTRTRGGSLPYCEGSDPLLTVITFQQRHRIRDGRVCFTLDVSQANSNRSLIGNRLSPVRSGSVMQPFPAG